MKNVEEKLVKEIDEFIEKFILKMESIPEDLEHLKLYLSNQMICQSVVWGARNLYEGIGMLEVAKAEYMEICKEVEAEAMENAKKAQYINTSNKGKLLN